MHLGKQGIRLPTGQKEQTSKPLAGCSCHRSAENKISWCSFSNCKQIKRCVHVEIVHLLILHIEPLFKGGSFKNYFQSGQPRPRTLEGQASALCTRTEGCPFRQGSGAQPQDQTQARLAARTPLRPPLRSTTYCPCAPRRAPTRPPAPSAAL